MKVTLLTCAAVAAVALIVPATTSLAAKKPYAQCMTDDGYGRFRPCSEGYKREHANWRSGYECMTDDGYGRYRPCSSGYKQKHAK